METLEQKLAYIERYKHASNAATASKVDANSNVTQKTIAGLEAELFKPDTIAINRRLVVDKLNEMFGDEYGKKYLEDLHSHLIYTHDETSLKPYCASITLYPFLLYGTKCLGGVSKAPKNLQSFCGGFVNLIYQIASNFSGAIATVEFLAYFDYFARKTYGADYLDTHLDAIKQELQGVVYAMNQPASARGDQSVFWNISVFDDDYAHEMFDEFYFPDGTQVDFKSLQGLQLEFMDWFREERTKELLTFPVLTVAMLTKDGKVKDTFLEEYCATQNAKGLSFFVYMSDSVDSLASCCRLRNELVDNTFSYTLGAGGVVTGSARVITINMNRLTQTGAHLDELVSRVHMYLVAHKAVLEDYIDNGLLPAYTQGFMDIDKQYLTVGVNGVLEGYEFFTSSGIIDPTDYDYEEYLVDILNTLKELNKDDGARYHVRFNTEFVPAENLGVKNAKWDKEAGLYVKRDCYNSYFYPVEDASLNVLDKIRMYRHDIVQYLDGGSALHLNLEQLLSTKQFLHLYDLCAKRGVSYWTTNVLCTICNSCGHIDPETRFECKECGSHDVDYGTRVIGYLKRISNFSEGRQKEANARFYHYLGRRGCYDTD